jgi:hypothetical protein
VSVRPTLPEQLRGLRHILENVVSPAVSDDYPQTTLQGVIRALEMLEARVDDVLPFLVHDNAQTSELLRAIVECVSLTGSIEPLAPVDMASILAIDAENERLRGLLADAIPALSAAPEGSPAADVHAAVVTHLRARIALYPFTSTGSLPSR